MKNFIFFYLFIFFGIINSCGQQKDHSELKFVYSDFVNVLKSKDDAALKEFTFRLVADQNTQKYMRENHLCYRGIPCIMDEKGMDISVLADKVYPNLIFFRNTLEHRGLLQDLMHIDETDYKYDTDSIKIYLLKKNGAQISENAYYSVKNSLNEKEKKTVEVKTYPIKGTDQPMQLKSKNNKISYSFGEMLSINNKWTLFTETGSDFSITE